MKHLCTHYSLKTDKQGIIIGYTCKECGKYTGDKNYSATIALAVFAVLVIIGSIIK